MKDELKLPEWEPEVFPDRRIKLILDNAGSKHSLTLRPLVLVLVALALVAGLTLLGIFAFQNEGGGNSAQVRKLETENRFLRETLDRYEAEMDSISTRLDTLKVGQVEEEKALPYFGGGGPSQHNQLLVNPGLATQLSKYESMLAKLKLRLGFDLRYAVVQLELPADFARRGDGIPSIYPTFGNLTDGWGRRVHPITKEFEFHTGIDIANKVGTPVYATADGVVAKAHREPGFGKLITISHTAGYTSLYGHLSSIRVTVGQAVHKGQIIGLMGDTGYSTGPHLHYGVSRSGEAQNPTVYLNRIDSGAYTSR